MGLLKDIRVSSTVKKSSLERNNRSIANGNLGSQSREIGGRGMEHSKAVRGHHPTLRLLC